MKGAPPVLALLLVGGLTVVTVGCGDGGMGPATPTRASKVRAAASAAGLSALASAPIRPVGNPYVAERVDLGHLLFFDPILSGPEDVACSTCHLPRLSFADGRQFPSGAGGRGLGPARSDPEPPPLRLMPRNSPPVFNAGLYGRMSTTPSVNGTMFWSGSAFGLEDQVLNPIAADNELRGTTFAKAVAIDSIIARLRSIDGYLDRFRGAFPEVVEALGDAPEVVVTPTTLRLALAAYLRELITPESPFDHFMRGDDGALSGAQLRGLELFSGAAGCTGCHRGPLLSDFTMRVIGAPQTGLGRDTTPGDDLGWGEHGGTPYAFRTAPLRQVSLTAPYLHAGTESNLLDVLRFKNLGVSAHQAVGPGQLDPAIRPLGLGDGDLQDLMAFLIALTDTISTRGPLFLPPGQVPSGLVIPR